MPAALALAMLLAACRGEETAAEPPPTSNRETTEAPRATTVPDLKAVDDGCKAELGEFLDALTQLDSELGVGLTFDDYGRRVGDIRLTYDRIEVANVGPQCLATVALPAERALNRYVEADNIWKNCEEELGCAEKQVMPKLRSKWRQATKEIDEAETGLAALRR